MDGELNKCLAKYSSIYKGRNGGNKGNGGTVSGWEKGECFVAGNTEEKWRKMVMMYKSNER